MYGSAMFTLPYEFTRDATPRTVYDQKTFTQRTVRGQVHMQSQQFQAEITQHCTLNYWLHLPANYDKTQRYPLLMFLHGAGERGNDLDLVKLHGPLKEVAEGRDLPFIIVAPQCPADELWFKYEDALFQLLDHVKNTQAVDHNRIYLTGLSMGGYMTWHMASQQPERFAAVIPICGGYMRLVGYPQRVCRMKDVPTWAFHGALDDLVSVAESVVLVETLKACGGHPQLTIYPEADHDSWTATYANPQIYKWLLAHSLTDRV